MNNETLLDTNDKAVMASKWCVDCYVESVKKCETKLNLEYAYYIYNGKSLCEKHFILLLKQEVEEEKVALTKNETKI